MKETPQNHLEDMRKLVFLKLDTPPTMQNCKDK